MSIKESKKGTTTINKKSKKNKERKINRSDNWFCHACKVNRKEDMRICIRCQKWYHEECVGLTQEDNDDFICPDCIISFRI